MVMNSLSICFSVNFFILYFWLAILLDIMFLGDRCFFFSFGTLTISYTLFWPAKFLFHWYFYRVLAFLLLLSEFCLYLWCGLVWLSLGSSFLVSWILESECSPLHLTHPYISATNSWNKLCSGAPLIFFFFWTPICVYLSAW